MDKIIEKISAMGVVPVVAIENASDVGGLGDALIGGGLPCAEITFRTAAAASAIRNLCNSHPGILVGAGTVLTKSDAETAVDAGASFVVTPGFDGDLVDWCLGQRIPVIPGVMTPTDINAAINRKLNVLKFFPAEAAGGVKTLKAISGPYGSIKFVPTGGITLGNLEEYLSLPNVVACGGSWLVKKDQISSGEFDTIESLVREAVQLVDRIRGK
ncbi:MAG: bifunctional 4-hydroxy-2-oxoglutarate aldolase/2-dehydro-3-deoxy-phosphogluconate aldolase [Chloroflexota bacterium]|nr:bifunctional 4-hydroxy-2-oxoglutarate aldolase/2-dehydro-3-deoxy-phosphogluconate aldolase [Anaerolineales bacterium]MEE3229371.1 bifunctional 4-hydroxy-2-oxoglutarate aldolase/2-dehydro-3-deoxy-phosphogluconate aldolase [Chloroflexota bacterium]HJO90919.1 bifunctional 4-hydroxy-2-oxoglutarate aldolase/2-dehydro-3-deoxy-phosphogluconate aldolase [Anaerolineales bacterium]|tara:strand:- start:248 stop:889 length:642 start_codon:yes stop_codon:yes gene_type:complete